MHLIRHIWATEFIEETQNFSVAPAILGNELEPVRRHYAYVRTRDKGRHADKFTRSTALDAVARALRPIQPPTNLRG